MLFTTSFHARTARDSHGGVAPEQSELCHGVSIIYVPEYICTEPIHGTTLLSWVCPQAIWAQSLLILINGEKQKCFACQINVMMTHIRKKTFSISVLNAEWSVRGSYLSSVSSSSWLRSHAMYSRAASVMRGHQDRSRLRSFCRFSAISSTPSSVILLHPDRLRIVRFGSEWTVDTKRTESLLEFDLFTCTGTNFVQKKTVLKLGF